MARAQKRPAIGRRRKRIMVYRPERHGRRWRIEIRDGATGARERPSFASEADAWDAYRAAKRESARCDSQTVGELIEVYLERQRAKGNRLSSLAATRHRLTAFFAHHDEHAPAELTPADCERRYRERVASGMAVDSHRNELAEVKTFCRWLVDRGDIRRSPVEDVKPIGRRKRGKPTLRPAEAQRFLATCIERAASGNDASLGCAIALLCGLRASEITRRHVRDVDPLTRTLHVERSKTQAGNRVVEIPAVLWPLMHARTDGRPATDVLFPSPLSDDGYHWRSWVRTEATRICRQLQIQPVSAHGLRGTHAALARQAGATAHQVAATLGHEHTSTTIGHYIGHNVDEAASRRAALRVLEGGADQGAMTQDFGESEARNFPQAQESENGQPVTARFQG